MCEWIKSLHDQCENANVVFDFIGTGNIFVHNGKVYGAIGSVSAVQT